MLTKDIVRLAQLLRLGHQALKVSRMRDLANQIESAPSKRRCGTFALSVFRVDIPSLKQIWNIGRPLRDMERLEILFGKWTLDSSTIRDKWMKPFGRN